MDRNAFARNIYYEADNVMQAEIHHLESNDHVDWQAFLEYRPPDPCDEYGWFHLTIGATGVKGGNDFQLCVATPRAVARVASKGFEPGILVDKFEPALIASVIHARIESVHGHGWEQIVDELRAFMRWEFEGMA